MPSSIIKCAALLIGMLSEEAIESRNKDFRNYRELYTRKISREKTMRDLFNRLLLSSDQKISSMSRSTSLSHRYSEPLSEEVLKQLEDPMLPNNSDQNSDSECD